MQLEGEERSDAGRTPTGSERIELTVNGEVFIVTARPDDPATADYEWVTGPNPGYGFSSTQLVSYGSVVDRAGSPTPDFGFESVERHREAIRNFLGQIDPETGYLAD